MRIIAGTAKGHALKCQKGTKTRPTLDRVREAVFNVLGPSVIGAKFLDLFAGTGAVGIEALSRGADLCYFNEINKKSYVIIQENLAHCRLESQAKVFNRDAMEILELIRNELKIKFNIVYLDPPYQEQFYDVCLRNLSKGILAEGALVIAETGVKEILPEKYQHLKLFKTGRYGDTKIWYYRKTKEQ